ncbi:Pyridoxal kinase [Taenia solium]|eukprot:TsM_000777300 transcript=TsM_000777300 gene=TsM_000777300
MESKRVLSVQSHVVHGYVGNKSAVFPLQLHNYEVDNINSVQLSCHTQYIHCSGQVLTRKHLDSIYDSLRQNGSANYDALLTGYVGDPDFLIQLAGIAVETKSDNPSCRFYCDPVIGDNGHIYVPEELVPIYREKILPIADILLPNQFEAELLTGCKITDEDSAFHCINLLHSTHGIPTIILSSTELFFEDEQGLKQLATYISYRPDLAELRKCGKFTQRVRALFPKLEATFFGTGDLFSSLTLIYFEKNNGNLDMAKALYKIQCTMHAVLKRTLEYAENLNSGRPLITIKYGAAPLLAFEDLLEFDDLPVVSHYRFGKPVSAGLRGSRQPTKSEISNGGTVSAAASMVPQ